MSATINCRSPAAARRRAVIQVPRRARSNSGQDQSAKSDGGYTVKPGDCLSVIAEQHGVSLQALRKANPHFTVNGRNVDLIHPGEKVRIPNAEKKTTPADSFDRAKKSPSNDVTAVKRRPLPAKAGSAPRQKSAARQKPRRALSARSPLARRSQTKGTAQPSSASVSSKKQKDPQAPPDAGQRYPSILPTLASVALTEATGLAAKLGERLSGGNPHDVEAHDVRAVRAQADAMKNNHDTDASRRAYEADPTAENWHAYKADVDRDMLIRIADKATVDGKIDAGENLLLTARARSIEFNDDKSRWNRRTLDDVIPTLTESMQNFR